MALGKAAKQKRKQAPIIQRKLDAKILTDEFYEEFKDKLDIYDLIPRKKFKMYVYSHPLLFGTEQTKDRWLTWIDEKRARNLNK